MVSFKAILRTSPIEKAGFYSGKVMSGWELLQHPLLKLARFGKYAIPAAFYPQRTLVIKRNYQRVAGDDSPGDHFGYFRLVRQLGVLKLIKYCGL